MRPQFQPVPRPPRPGRCAFGRGRPAAHREGAGRAQRHAAGVRRRPAGGCMRRPLPLGLSPRSGRSLAPGRLFRAALRAPNIPLTAAPHGVGCEVTRGDPGGGGGALFRRSIDGLPATRPFKVHPRPAHHLPGSPTRSLTSSLLPPAPPPLQARPWPPNSRSSLRERAAARRFSRASGGGGSAPTFATQGLAAWAPTTGLRRARVSLPTRELGGAQCVCICLCLCLCLCLCVYMCLCLCLCMCGGCVSPEGSQGSGGQVDV